MLPGSIEIRTRDVKGIPDLGIYSPQHSYIIFTLENGVQFEISAHNVDGKLKVVKGYYNSYNPNPYIQTDYTEDANSYRSAVIFKGTTNEILSIKNKMEGYGTEINLRNFDYKVAVVDLIDTDIINNCNSFTYNAILRGGLTFTHPTYPDGTKVTMPGLEGKIDHTTLDLITMSTDTSARNEIADLYTKVQSNPPVDISGYSDMSSDSFFSGVTDPFCDSGYPVSFDDGAFAGCWDISASFSW